MGNMKHKIRQPEVAAVYKALKNYVESKGQHGPSFTPFPATLVPGTFEGGDALLHDGGLFVGVGSRTSEHGAQSIALSKHSGKNSYLVRIPPASGWRQDMYVMHLDTFFMPLTQKTVLGCEVVLDACVLEEVHGGGKQNFLGYLEQRYDIIDVPQKEQNNFAANVLGVGSGKIVVPSEQNPLTNKLLKANNFNTYNAGFKELTKGFGASHCMVLALERDNGPASEYFPGNG